MEWAAQRPRRAGPLNCLHGTQGQENQGSVLGAVFSFPLCGAFDDSCSKGCFCDQGKLTLVLFERPTVLCFSNLGLLKSCHSWYLLCVGSGKGLRTPSKQKAGCWGGAWVNWGPFNSSRLHTHLFYIIEGNCAEALLWSEFLTLSSLTPFCPASVAFI